MGVKVILKTGKIYPCRRYYLRKDDLQSQVTIISKNPNKRGNDTPPNKTLDEMIHRVKKHIQRFPSKESHYCRKSTQRQYLDPLSQ